VDCPPNSNIGAEDPATLGQKLLESPAASLRRTNVADQPTTSQARMLARLLDTAIIPFVGADFSGRITCVNQAFADLVGCTVGDLLRRTVHDITAPSWREALNETLARVAATGASMRSEAECIRLDGQVFPVEAAIEPDRDPHGEIVGLYAFVKDLARRRNSEQALRESEERFRRLYDEAPVGYHEVDTEGRLVNINQTECDLLGYTREEMLGRSVFDFIAEEHREAARAAFPDKVSGKFPLKTLERTIVTHDGRRIAIEIEERYKRDSQGRIVGLLSTVQDVTHRKRTEAALVASQRRARALYEGIEDAVFVHALDGRILDANPAASRLLGYTREELLAMTTADIDDPSFAAGYDDRLARQIATGHLACEGRHRTKDGRVLPVEINSSMIQLDDQKAVLAVIRDISERIALEATRRAFAESRERYAREMAAKNSELTLSEARYRRLTEGCLDGVVVADRMGRITLFNSAAGRIFGYTTSELLGCPLAQLMPQAFGDAGDRPFEDLVIYHDPELVGRTVELIGRRKNGEEFPLELSLSAIDRDEDFQFIGSIRDQTERQRMRAMLAQSEKLASIGLLSAGVAHEINNPLAYVGNNVAVLERDVGSLLEMIALYESTTPELAAIATETLARIHALAEEFDWKYVRENLPRMLNRTRDGVQRVANIVSNLRGLARTAPPKMELAEIPDMVESALEMVRGRLRRNHIELVVDHGPVPAIVCVPAQISQVILNLLINATQAIESLGRTEGGQIRFTTWVEESDAVLAVFDNGCGIDAESLPRLFDPFFTTKDVGEGTGLGLSICHGIVTGHGGRIEVQSQSGGGTTFRILLPLTSS
jgi:PAS domain S-box-containing protein